MKLVTYLLLWLLSLTLVLGAKKSSGYSWSSGIELRRPAVFGIEEVLAYEVRSEIFKNDHCLLKDNYAGFSLETSLTPLTIMEKLSVSISPVAFWKIGGSVCGGYGWRIFEIYGTGINEPAGKRYKSGLVHKSNIYSQLQIETKDLFRNELLNFQVALIENVTYRKFTTAMGGQSWIFQDDKGENFNGWNWNQIFFAGYQYPLAENKALTAGSLFTIGTDLTNYEMSIMSSGGWGSDFLAADISPLVNVQYSKNLEFTVLLKFSKEKLYKNDSKGAYFAQKQYDRSEYQYNRVQAQVKYSFGRKDWE